MEEERNDVIALTDEEGNELLFEILDVISHKERAFAVLLPTDEVSDEVTILEVKDGDAPDEEYLEGIEDEALLEEVFGLFNERLGAEQE